MFNKENKKTNPLDENLKSVKFHTMKDDLTNKKDEEAVPIAVESQVNGISKTKDESPFLDKSFVQAQSQEKAIFGTNGDDLPQENKKELGAIEGVGFSAKSNYADNYTENSAEASKSADATNPEGINKDMFSDNSDFVALEENDSRGSVFLYIVIFIIIILLGAGGYYFWMVKEGKTGGFTLIQDTFESLTNKETEVETTPKDEEIVPIKDTVTIGAEFSEKTNFLVIGNGELSQTGIKAAIEEKFLAMDKYQGDQLEFLLVDKNNKPVAFKDFASSFGITLGTDITNNLELSNFSIFLYKKDNVKRVSLVLSVKDKEALSASLLKNEKTLVNGLTSLFIYDKIENTTTLQFNESKYGTNVIRYVNLNKKLDLSLDYSISGDYLILATNKDSGRQIIDRLSGELEKNENIFSPND